MRFRLILSLLVGITRGLSGAQERPLEGTRIAEATTDSILPNAVTISLARSAAREFYPAPSAISFVDPHTIVEDDGIKDATGRNFETVVVLSQENLLSFRAAINRLATFKSVARFTSERSKRPGAVPPDYPKIDVRFGNPVIRLLEIRATSIYKDAYYIDEFAEIETVPAAAAFLEGLAEEMKDTKARAGLLQIRDSLIKGAEALRTTPPPKIPPLPKERLLMPGAN